MSTAGVRRAMRSGAEGRLLEFDLDLRPPARQVVTQMGRAVY